MLSEKPGYSPAIRRCKESIVTPIAVSQHTILGTDVDHSRATDFERKIVVPEWDSAIDVFGGEVEVQPSFHAVRNDLVRLLRRLDVLYDDVIEPFRHWLFKILGIRDFMQPGGWCRTIRGWQMSSEVCDTVAQ